MFLGDAVVWGSVLGQERTPAYKDTGYRLSLLVEARKKEKSIQGWDDAAYHFGE